MKAALCFIISYEHTLNKEQIWKDWVEPNKDIINVYFHYKDYDSIKSEWIKKNALPKKYLVKTDYLHIVPAYLTLMLYGITNDANNQWFCFLTETCVPIISPLKFRELFFENYQYSFMSWKKAWWNTTLVKRANLHYLQQQFHLANTPWFILNRQDAHRCIHYSQINKNIYKLICQGDVANESIFSIMLYAKNSLKMVKNEDTTATDWSRMMNSTSPYLFKDGSLKDKSFIDDFLKKNKNTIFLRKVDKSFPNSVLQEYITKEDNDTPLITKRKNKIFWLHKKFLFLKYLYLMQSYFKLLFFPFVIFFSANIFYNYVQSLSETNKP